MSIFSKNTPATETESSTNNEEAIQEQVTQEEFVVSTNANENWLIGSIKCIK